MSIRFCTLLTLFSIIGFFGCKKSFNQTDSVIKTDEYDRAIIGVGSSYNATEVDAREINQDMQKRRALGWRALEEAIRPVSIKNSQQKIPNWQTWYSATEYGRILKKALERLTPEELAARAPLSEALIIEVMEEMGDERNVLDQNALAKRIRAINNAPEGAAGGHFEAVRGFTIFSPEMVIHFLKNYHHLERCNAFYVSENFPAEYVAPNPDNFAPCLDEEFPENAVMVKTVWESSDFPSYKSDLKTLKNTFKSGQWPESGSVDPSTLSDQDIYSIVDPNGRRHYLNAIHVSTKEVREWVWASFWWSEDPDQDFGMDRPNSVSAHYPGFANYKMCVATDFYEGDSDVGSGLPMGLAKVLEFTATGMKNASGLQRGLTKADRQRDLTWCANPYLEGNFPLTNCIGCHQAAPLRMETPMVGKVRNNFPADFPMAYSREFGNATLEVLFQLDSSFNGLSPKSEPVPESPPATAP